MITQECRHTFLMFLEPFPVGRDQAFRIDSLSQKSECALFQGAPRPYIDLLFGFILAHSQKREERQQLLRYTDPGGPSAEEQDLVIFQRLIGGRRREACGVNEPGQDDSTYSCGPIINSAKQSLIQIGCKPVPWI